VNCWASNTFKDVSGLTSDVGPFFIIFNRAVRFCGYPGQAAHQTNKKIYTQALKITVLQRSNMSCAHCFRRKTSLTLAAGL